MISKTSFEELPFDVIYYIARLEWNVWYKICVTLKIFGLYSLIPTVQIAAKRHFQYKTHTMFVGYCLCEFSSMSGFVHGYCNLKYLLDLKNFEKTKPFITSTYRMGEIHGTLSQYDLFGHLKKQLNFRDGTIHGTCFEKCGESGKSAKSGESGEKIITMTYNEGILQNVEISRNNETTKSIIVSNSSPIVSTKRICQKCDKICYSTCYTHVNPKGKIKNYCIFAESDLILPFAQKSKIDDIF